MVKGMVNSSSSDVWVWGQARLLVTLAAEFDFSDFPFDSQRVGMSLESAEYLAEELQFIAVNQALDGFLPAVMRASPGRPISGWKIMDRYLTNNNIFYQSLGETYNRQSFWLTLERFSVYYTSRFVFGQAAFVIMTLFVLWFVCPPRDVFSSRRRMFNIIVPCCGGRVCGGAVKQFARQR
jgi:hypothetical protein